MSDTKTPGQRAYEQDVALEPTYPDGTPRRPWHALPEWAQWSWERNPTARANARLIAAAPELLAVLRECAEFIPQTTEGGSDRGYALQQSIRAAIAKATAE